MVVRADILLGIVENKERQILKSAETTIDEKLSKEYKGGKQIAFFTSIFDGVGDHGRDELLDKYREAGWNVEYFADQKDGDTYLFQHEAVFPSELADVRQEYDRLGDQIHRLKDRKATLARALGK